MSGWRVERVSGLPSERESAHERGRWITYKVTTDSDVVNMVASEGRKAGSGSVGGGSLLFSPGTLSGCHEAGGCRGPEGDWRRRAVRFSSLFAWHPLRAPFPSHPLRAPFPSGKATQAGRREPSIRPQVTPVS